MLEYEEIICNLCGSEKYDVIYEKNYKDEEVELDNMFAASSAEDFGEQVVKCSECGLVYVNPRLKQEYILSGYSEADNSLYVKERDKRLDTFRSGVKLLEKFTGKSKGRLLDVGCAAGFFLSAARDAGWEVYGVEPSRWFKKYAEEELGLEIKNGGIRDLNLEPGFFDAITFWDVLEHSADPMEDLKKAGSLLKKNGILLINYPAFDSIWSKIFKRKWWFLLSVHLYYFTKPILRRYLDETGFEIISFRLHWQYMGLGYLVYRLKAYSKMLYKILDFLVRMTGTSELKVKYYASQVNVIAKKK